MNLETMLAGATESLLRSYAEDGALNHSDSENLPSKHAITEICAALLRLLYPGFHDDAAVDSRRLGETTRARLEALAGLLEDQVCKSLRAIEPGCPRLRAAGITRDFLGYLPELRGLLRSDVEAAFEGDPAARNFEEIILAYPFIEAIAVQRSAHFFYVREVPLLPRIMTEWAHARTGIDIHPGAQIGRHFFIDHGTGVVIGETCRIGNRVKLYHGVTLGARSFQRDDTGKIVKGGKRHPDVGDGVTIYPNSTILGGETVVGEGSTIGANVYLMHSVPPHSLVYLEEGQIRMLHKKANKA
jgi:serine O-acetyltransferase